MRKFYLKDTTSRLGSSILCFLKKGRILSLTDLASYGTVGAKLQQMINEGTLVEIKDEIPENLLEELSVDNEPEVPEEVEEEEEEEEAEEAVKVCIECGNPLVGRQKKYCADCKAVK